MSLQVEKLEKNMAKLTIEVSAEELEKALQKAYNKQKGKFNIPGFRKGKVTRQVIEKMFGPEVFYNDAADELLPTAYEKAYDESGLEIVSAPTIDIVQLEKGKPFIFTAEVALKPEVTLGEYKGLTVDKTEVEVAEEEVEEKLAEEQNKNARIVSVEDRAVQDGDDIILDFEGFVDGVAFEGGKGENHQLKIGSGSFIPGFEEQLIGAEIETDVEVNVTFPEEYHAKDLAGKPAVFKCKVHEIKAKELPDLDDDFAAEVSEFDTLEEYREDLRTKLFAKKADDAKRAKEDQAVEKAVANASMEIPEAMIDTQAKQLVEEFESNMQQRGLTMEQYFQFTGMTEEKMLEEVRPQAVRRIETRLVLEAVVKAENIEISDEQFEAEIAKMAEVYKMEAEQLKNYMGEAGMKQIKKDMAVQEAVTLIAESAEEV